MHPRREPPLQESTQGHSTELERRVILERPDRPLGWGLARLEGPGIRNLIPQSGPSVVAIPPSL